MPNFLMVGAPKAGTTSIAKYLGEHPDIYISDEKEPFYFLPNILKDTNPKDPMYGAIKERAHLDKTSYLKLFEGATTEKMRGEATVHYLYHYKEVIPRVKKELGDIPIIIVLRNPALRAFSNYKFQYDLGDENKSFEEALKIEEQRKSLGWNSFWYYKEVGNYSKPISAYLKNFSNVHICLFEDLKKNPIQFMQDIYSFLEVDSNFVPDTEVKYNQILSPSNELVRRILYVKRYLTNKTKLKIKLPGFIKKKLFVEKKRKELNEVIQHKLELYYKDDILALEKILRKKITVWKLNK